MIRRLRIGLWAALAGLSMSLFAPTTQANTAANADPQEFAQLQQTAREIRGIAKQREGAIQAYNQNAKTFRSSVDALNKEMTQLIKAIKEKSQARQDFDAERRQLQVANQKMDNLVKSFFPAARGQVNTIFALERKRQKLQQKQVTFSMELSKKQIRKKLKWLLEKQKEDFTVVRRNQIYILNRYIDQLSVKQSSVISELSQKLSNLQKQQSTLLGKLVPTRTPPNYKPE